MSDAEFNYQNRRYLNANNRAYYAIFHAIRAVLATERIDFKRHKDVLAYFNQYYVKTEIFPRSISRKISQSSKVREDSDYDDEFIPTDEETKAQIDAAKEMGFTAVLVEENPANYNSRGFVTSADYGIIPGKNMHLPKIECLMIKELVPGHLEKMHGVVDYGFYKTLSKEQQEIER